MMSVRRYQQRRTESVTLTWWPTQALFQKNDPRPLVKQQDSRPAPWVGPPSSSPVQHGQACDRHCDLLEAMGNPRNPDAVRPANEWDMQSSALGRLACPAQRAACPPSSMDIPIPGLVFPSSIPRATGTLEAEYLGLHGLATTI